MLTRSRELLAEELLYVDDFGEFVSIGRRMQEECEPTIPFSELVTRANLFNVTSDTKRVDRNCWIVRHKGVFVGFGVANSFQYLFSDARIASLALWYVTPPYRKSRVAFEIFHTFEHWAKVIGAVRIEVGAAKAIGDPDDINRMFTKRGFVRYGELFYKQLEGSL